MEQHGVRFKTMIIPYFFMVATWMPLFLIALITPDHADSEFLVCIENFIDRNLFSDVGALSTNFPFVSKIITNYICLVAPLFAVVFCYLTLKKSTLETKLIENLSRFKALLCIFGLTLLVFAFIYITYFDTTHLEDSRKLALVGKYKILYAVYSSGLMFLYYVLFLLSYLLYRYLPKMIVKGNE
ncbi:hypothetical protein JH25_27600 [Pseudomonas sp. BRG-100]|uniref:hypothetical protein n=1 Tax=Pseudomonas sp. BRG-100 TaxID=1524267 RepID=UPI0004E7B8A7|nr:hypothetical protein [Pseudomonas sp. BRG-100]KFF42144.1 hypothetical protein JH25_27600 [Pseudomonas sp. BRG-100]